MNLVVDMNLSPEWLPYLWRSGWDIQHWQNLGQATAEDDEILAWARNHLAVVFTQDLDFVQLLHASGAAGPSVVRLRIADEHDDHLRRHVAFIIHQAERELRRGTILSINEKGARLRDLPLPATRPRKRPLCFPAPRRNCSPAAPLFRKLYRRKHESKNHHHAEKSRP